jgi:hypothetical protein
VLGKRLIDELRRSGGGWPEMVKKVLTWCLVAFLIFFIAYRPQNAAQVAHSLFGGIVDIAQGFGDFFSSLVA